MEKNNIRTKGIIALFLFVCLNSAAQNFTVSTSSNFIYQYIANPIEIFVERTKCGKFKVSTNNGTIEKSHDCQYTIIPEKIGEATVSIYKPNGKLIGKRIFRVKEIQVEAYVDGFGIEKMYVDNVGAFSHHPGLYTMRKDAVCSDWDQSKLNYEVLIVKKTGTPIKLKSETNSFTPEMRESFSKMETGDVIIFHNIIFTLLPESKLLKNIVLEVK